MYAGMYIYIYVSIYLSIYMYVCVWCGEVRCGVCVCHAAPCSEESIRAARHSCGRGLEGKRRATRASSVCEEVIWH